MSWTKEMFNKIQIINLIFLVMLFLQHGKTRGEDKEAANGSSAFLIIYLHVQVKASVDDNVACR